MEQSLSSLAFKGSILEAITEAKREKKLFVVYNAGDNPDSKLLETSTWTDPSVSETLSKYCVLLHILEGSSEASNFSAIYPQQSAPCITAIGYNGVQLWQKDGFVSADVLASSLEKAWLSLHVQDTTAAFLTAALASGKHLASGTSEAETSEQVTPGAHVSTPLSDDPIVSVDAEQPLHSDNIEDRSNYEDAFKETDSKKDDVAIPEPSRATTSDNDGLDESISKIETGNTSQDTAEIVHKNPKVANLDTGKNVDFHDNNSGSSNVGSREIVNEASAVVHVNTVAAAEVEKTDASDSSAIKSNDVFLNIRLPDGSSLQVKFLVTDTLKMVKDYIHENQTSGLRSFSIAIPYPRKVFNDQDLNSTLSELGFFKRQALVVVPHNKGGSSQPQTYSSTDTASSNASEGYWASVRRILSYANPFSYLGRGASSPSASPEPQSGLWQYSPNPSLQNNLRDGGGPSPAIPSEQSGPGTSGENSRKRQQSARFGGNIHTLKHDEEDDSRFNDRNAFWNGNSTQYGGGGDNNNNDGK
ncbi:hypothetical protein ABFS82_14G043200 [Erythranthe guttata]|uniref:plant UBX domain-containing protein 11 n=1 Tax=Erythranthe guttata TaxID=4155 RepID=UPI00064D84A2|nr:PREDICTED: plant UBX domain-containing protein 11 [Erythranthe guttata]|eukprot:XP_012843018.1 PREDICTED: plant UBX domain-containing protein 11 [Erythranthe guttata]